MILGAWLRYLESDEKIKYPTKMDKSLNRMDEDKIARIMRACKAVSSRRIGQPGKRCKDQL